MQFELIAPFKISPGQEAAVDQLVSNFSKKDKQTLLGITGSGKTFVMANVINRLQKPTLIIAHNKILAAQLYGELKELFPTQPRGILHFLLRLLSARIVLASAGHVH